MYEKQPFEFKGRRIIGNEVMILFGSLTSSVAVSRWRVLYLRHHAEGHDSPETIGHSGGDEDEWFANDKLAISRFETRSLLVLTILILMGIW